jgi:heme O synthase-like polyprenyltransferase
LPRVFDIGGSWYGLTATALACAAIFGTIYGMTPHANARWARSYFLSTLLYLPLLLGVLVLDRL